MTLSAHEKSLFYIEDDDVLAKVTQRSLSKRGFKIYHTSSLHEAKPIIDKQPFQYALLDLKVDDGLTLETIALLKDKNPNVRILVLTGYASIATAVQAIKLGATDYLAKPATIDDILTALEGKTNTNELADQDQDTTDTMSVKRLEWEHIQRALTENDGNISATARQLKMHRRTLQRKLQKKPVSE